MKPDNKLPPLPISSVFVIAKYGWKHTFSEVSEALAFISTITELVEDPATPIDSIQVLVEFETGDNERCSYKDKQRAQHWLERFNS